MLRTLLLPLALLGLLATLPAASACPDDCVEPIVVCQDLIPWACFELDPDRVLDATALDDAVRDLIAPCTCDPIE